MAQAITTSGLPIDAALPALRAALSASRNVVLHAPPGAGKSTVVPLALLDEPWVRGRRILLQEPRRLAARAVAERMASTLGSRVGDVVGLRMRLETRVSRATRIEVVTEGVLTRMLQSDPALEGVAAVLFDEFHERSLASDLALTLCLDAQSQVAEELRVLVMSATLDTGAIAALLDGAPVVGAEGRQFPVETRYAGKALPLLPGGVESPERAVVGAVQQALRDAEGDVLVFLPGAPEIRRVAAQLGDAPRGDTKVTIHPLYGDLAPDVQQAALRPSRPGERKIVLATNIAETSLTIEGVRVVIDSGLVRRSVFDPVTGMNRLETQRISRASADQRQGRAGRVSSGVCYRLWSEGAQRSLAPFTPPEIANADLSPLALDLAAWGVRDVSELRWLDPPPAAMLASARDLLRDLEAIDAAGRPTPEGRAMAALSTHPRFAHMLLRARGLELQHPGAISLAATIAALLSERDAMRGGPGDRDADFGVRLAAAVRGSGIDGGALQRIRRSVDQLVRQLGESSRSNATVALADELAGVLLAFAYPDRIGRRREGDEPRYALANGRGARFADAQSIARAEFIVALDLDDRDRDARIQLAVRLDREDLPRYFGSRIATRDDVHWDPREEVVVATRTTRLGELVLDSRPLRDVPADAALGAMLAGVRALGIEVLPWTRETRDLQARMQFVHGLHGDGADGGSDAPARAKWPDVSDPALLARVDEWLSPWLDGVTRRSHLARIPLHDALLAALPHAQRRELDALAPATIALPTGTNARIDYLDDNAPCVSVRMQEVFGAPESPRIGGGRVPVTFKLLSPAQRPLQITRDLASFWRGAYADVRKDMRGRYPKHHWPENPLEAEPSRGARRRK